MYGERAQSVPMDAPVVVMRGAQPVFAAGTEGIWWRRPRLVLGSQVWRMPWSAVDRTTIRGRRLRLAVTRAAAVSEPALPRVVSVVLADCRQHGRPMPCAEIGPALERLSGGWVRVR